MTQREICSRVVDLTAIARSSPGRSRHVAMADGTPPGTVVRHDHFDFGHCRRRARRFYSGWTPAAGSVLPDDNRVFRNQISAVDSHARIAHATRRRRYGTRHSNSKMPRKSDLSALCDPARNDSAHRRRDYICAHDSVAACAIAAQQYRPRDLHRVHFADLCRTRRFTPYPWAFAGMPFSRLRNWNNLATDPQCKNQLGCELSEARRSHSILDGGRTFIAQPRRFAVPCKTHCFSLLGISLREPLRNRHVGPCASTWPPCRSHAISTQHPRAQAVPTHHPPRTSVG